MSESIFCCLVEGDSKLFSIICPLTTPIFVLKKLIRDDIESTSHAGLANDLTLWKVDLAPPSKDERKGLTGDNKQGSVKLEGFNTVSDYWPETTPLNPGHLHIIVELSVLGDDDRSSPKRRRLNDKCPEGWIQLPDHDKWKRFGDYWRKKDATTMSDGLSITLAYDEKGVKDPIYCLPFDVTTENRIIVRDCYKPLYDYIWELRSLKARGLVLSGQPGTGKTLWLSYALVRLLIANETVVYHSNTGTYLFSGNSVYRRTLGAIPEADSATFCLIDLDHTTDPSEIGFMTHQGLANTFPVMATSPNPSRYKSWQKQRQDVSVEYMPLWERVELKKGLEIQSFYDDLRQDVATVLYATSDDKKIIHEEWRNVIDSALEVIIDSMVYATEDHATEGNAMNDVLVTVDEVLDKLLDNITEAYGSSARDVYEAIHGPGVARESIDRPLRGLTYDSLHEAVTKVRAAGPKDTVPHTIFSMYPTETIGNAHAPKRSDRIVSKSSLNLFRLEPWFLENSTSHNTSKPRFY